MLKKIIDWFNEPITFKRKKAKKTARKINNLNEVLLEQADSINFLIQQLDMKKETTVRQERKIRDLKKDVDFLTKRHETLQEIEQLFVNGKPTIAQIRKIINGK